MLKRSMAVRVCGVRHSVAFGRLCVETALSHEGIALPFSVAFGRLCVETYNSDRLRQYRCHRSPSGGCVLKQNWLRLINDAGVSVAFGRLCVETVSVKTENHAIATRSPSGGCVLKRVECIDLID